MNLAAIFHGDEEVEVAFLEIMAKACNETMGKVPVDNKAKSLAAETKGPVNGPNSKETNKNDDQLRATTESLKLIARHIVGTTKQNSKANDPIAKIIKDPGMPQENPLLVLIRRSLHAPKVVGSCC